MVDQLVMLLSTDWFEPYWDALDIEADDVARRAIQMGCPQIVGQILSGSTNYYHISFAPERIGETRSLLQSLTLKFGTNESLPDLIEEWDDLSDEDKKAACIWDAITSSVFSGRIQVTEPSLDQVITEIMFSEHKTYDMEPFEFATICEKSQTVWDRYTRTLMPELPTALADTPRVDLNRTAF